MVEEIQDVQASKKVNVTPQNKDALLDKFNAQEAAKVETLEAAEAAEDMHLKLGRIVKMYNVPEERVNKWLETAGVRHVEDLDKDKTLKCIASLETENFTNGHVTIGQQ